MNTNPKAFFRWQQSNQPSSLDTAFSLSQSAIVWSIESHARNERMPDPRMGHLFGLVAEEGNEIVSVLALLQTTKGHLRAGNVFLWVLKVCEL